MSHFLRPVAVVVSLPGMAVGAASQQQGSEILTALPSHAPHVACRCSHAHADAAAVVLDEGLLFISKAGHQRLVHRVGMN